MGSERAPLAMNDSDSLRPGTRCVHGPAAPSGLPEALVAPVVHSATFRLDDEAYALRAAGEGQRVRVYSREANPTVQEVEGRLAALEGAEQALLFASGQAALHALLLSSLERGQHVVAMRDLYGGSSALLGELLPRLGVELSLVPVEQPDALERALRPETRLVYCESLSNPTLAAADLPRLAALAHGAGALLAVDATFVTPLLQRPLELGADLVMHSATKYLAGHSDVVGGVLAGSSERLAPALRWRTNAGGCLDPQAAFLIGRGLKTLHLRMDAHCANAALLAAVLAEHPAVERTHYPSLAEHPSSAVAARLLQAPGGMLSFVHAGGGAGAHRFLGALELFADAASLGGVESLAVSPARMSHAHLSPEQRAELGIADGLVRLSVGVEDVLDLEADLTRALEQSA